VNEPASSRGEILNISHNAIQIQGILITHSTIQAQHFLTVKRVVSSCDVTRGIEHASRFREFIEASLHPFRCLTLRSYLLVHGNFSKFLGGVKTGIQKVGLSLTCIVGGQLDTQPSTFLQHSLTNLYSDCHNYNAGRSSLSTNDFQRDHPCGSAKLETQMQPI
jgi:hypothetical protein